MRRNAISTLIFVLVIAVGIIVYVRRHPSQNGHSVHSSAIASDHSTDDATNRPAFLFTAKNTPDRLSEAEALEQTVRTLIENSKPDRSSEQLLQSLSNSGQEPIVARDQNQYTGAMTVIRTKNPLPGTRYFLAQYFSDEKGKDFPQHLSVEFRAGPDAFNNVVSALRKTRPDLGEPSMIQEGFMQWELNDGFVAWVKQLGPADIEEDGINPHTTSDIGTIWFAVELAPHDEDPAH